MARTKKIIKVIETETFEYFNASDELGKPEIMFIELEDEKFSKLLPGKSIFLTQNVIDRYMADGDIRFTEGRIRRKDAKNPGEVVEARDDMSEAEIEVMVRDVETAKIFEKKIVKINGIPTLKMFLKFIEKYDRPMSIHKVCIQRLERLEQERLDAMSPTMIPMDKEAARIQKQLLKTQ